MAVRPLSPRAVSAALFGTTLCIAPVAVRAGCEPTGTDRADTIVCSGTDTRSVRAGAGDDRVTVPRSAIVAVQMPPFAMPPTAIDAGSGNDVVLNEGTVSLRFMTTGSVASSGACPSWTTTDATARGINGAGGADTITNAGVVSVASLFRATAAVSVLTSGSFCAVPSGAFASGLEGAESSDRITNTGTVNVTATVRADAPVAAGNTAMHTTPPSPPSPPIADAVGIAGGTGGDRITNEGIVTVAATASIEGSQARAAGVTANGSGSEIVNRGTITVTATSTEGGPVSAVGIAGGNGKDTIANYGTIDVSATTSRETRTSEASLLGGESAVDETNVESRAVGIDAGSGKQQVLNAGSLTATATSTVNTLNVELNLIDKSHGDTTTSVLSTAIGISGGNGNDGIDIRNTGAISAQATSRVDNAAVEVNLVDAATANAKTEIEASATGIAGGRGRDSIANSGTINATATAKLSDFALNASFIDFTIADRPKEKIETSLNATAIGIDASQGKDDLTITHDGSVRAEATADAASLGITLASEGIPRATKEVFTAEGLAEIGITATSNASGIAAGTGNDHVASSGDITAAATSTATQKSINVGVALVEFKVPTPGVVVGRAGTESSATSTGIDGGDGNNEITNGGNVTSRATATASATTVSVNLDGFAFDSVESVPGVPLGGSLVVSDTTTIATATATGIGVGSGNDKLLNTGSVATSAIANSGSTSASADHVVKYKEGTEGNFLSLNGVGARSETEATATATGIDGGDGRNDLRNTGDVTVDATAGAHAVAVTVTMAGTLKASGGAVSASGADTSSTATADATGIKGGDGNDTIVNTGTIGVTATTNVDSVSSSNSFSVVSKGLVAGAALARAVTEGTSTAIGIDGGDGSNDIANHGTVNATANAHADSVAVAAQLDGTREKGLAAGVALVDGSASATATATGIRTGSEQAPQARHEDGNNGCHDCQKDDNQVLNTGAINVDAEANTATVSVAAKIGIGKEGAALGAGLADASATATGTAKGIEANARDDMLINAGQIGLRSVTSADAVSVALTVEGVAKGLAAGASLVDAHVNATSTATGIEAGDGDDHVFNTGTIATQEIKSTATAVGVATSVLIAKDTGVALGAALGNTSATATTNVTGIDGGAGEDKLYNTGLITLDSTKASADAVSVSLQVALAKDGIAAGAALADSTANATVTTKGIEGGAANDLIVNEGSITLQRANATANAVSVSVELAGAKDGVAIGAALVDADAAATVNATGLSGGDGRDTLANAGTIKLDDLLAKSDATGVSVGFKFAQEGLAIGAALAETGTKATINAAGMHGGGDNDELFNEGTVALSNVRAEAGAVSVSAELAGAKDGVTVAAALARATGTAENNTTAIDGGDGNDLVVNRGRLTASNINAHADANSISVALAGANAGVAAGVTLADTSAIAHATAKGIDGGTGDDELWNKGEIALSQVKADATSVSVGVSVSAALNGVSAGAALGRANVTAEAHVAGMDGGTGDDFLANKGSITVDGVNANGLSVGVSAQIGVTNAGVAIGAALVDAHSTGRATVSGLEGGTGNDELVNNGAINLRNIKSDAGATSVGVTLNAALSGGVAAGVALTDSGSTAEARVTGLGGGDGDDTLVNTGVVKIENVEAHARATGVSVTLQASMAGVAAGAAIANTSATARTDVIGLDGGAGNDVLYNKGAVDVQGKATTDSLGIGIGVFGSVGVSGGASIVNANSTATSTVMGIDGGLGHDQIFNDGSVKAASEAIAASAAISATVTVGVGGSATLADARSTSTAVAVGINDVGSADDPCKQRAQGVTMQGMRQSGLDVTAQWGDECQNDKRDKHGDGHGDGHGDVDVIANRGSVTADAKATARGTSVAAGLSGFMLGETTNASSATATGIRLESSRDAVLNEGAISATSSATTSGLSIAAGIAGRAIGDASSTATATATGIDTGTKDDEIENLGAITVDARSDASAQSIAVGLVGSVAANASITSTATAVGIDAGEGNDRIRNGATVTVSAGLPSLRDAEANCTAAAGGACAKATPVNVTIAGSGTVDASSTANAFATGIEGGKGDDDIDNDGTVTATALASARASSVNVTVFGATNADATSTASANATALSGGDGRDHIVNRGSVNVDAGAQTFTRTVVVQIAGAVSNAANTITNTQAAGISGGADDDAIANTDSGAITVKATTASTVTGSSWNFAGVAATDATLGAFTSASGITGGGGADRIFNAGVIDVTTNSALSVTGAKATAIFGNARAGSHVTSDALAVGIDGGDQDDAIRNTGRIDAQATATLASTATSFTFAGGASSAEVLTATATATGIAAGTGDNALFNEGRITANATATLGANGGASSTFGNATSAASVAGHASATGMAAAGGNDTLLNDTSGNIVASVTMQPTATNSSTGGAFLVDGITNSNANASASAFGLDAGGGDNHVVNRGTVTVTIRGTTTANSRADANELSSWLGVDADAYAFSTALLGTLRPDGTISGPSASAVGILTGNGRDRIANLGTLDVSATPQSSAIAFADAQAIASGDGTASGTARADDVEAVGIRAGDGDNMIYNGGTIRVTARPVASGDSRSDADGIGEAREPDSRATTVISADRASAIGIHAGRGENVIVNEGTIAVTAAPQADKAFAFGDYGGDVLGIDGFATTTANADNARAIGVLAEGTRNDVWNKADSVITVDATPRAVADSLARGVGFDGDASPIAHGNADSGLAVGIQVAGADNHVINDGTIRVTTNTYANAKAVGDPSSTGEIEEFAETASAQSAQAIGIWTGGANDQIANHGAIAVTSQATAEFVNPLATGHAGSLAVGIRTGDGAGSCVRNEGDLRISASASSTQLITSSGFNGVSEPTAHAIGIEAGNGSNWILNAGLIQADATATDTHGAVALTGSSYLGVSDQFGSARSSSLAVGIHTGDGTGNVVRNEGDLRISASATSDEVTFNAFGLFSARGISEATARAIGIEGGNGGNWVLNTGLIEANASATGATHAGAQAIGIRTGSGDDTIINRGTINTSQTTNGVTTTGVAIDAGAGNDQVILGDGSITNGLIDLGSGTNTLTLEGTPVLNGGIVDGQSSLTLQFLNDGSYDGALPGVVAIKDGQGTFTLSMLNRMERLEVRRGTLYLTRDYQFLPQGAFVATVYGDGSNGQFRIGGLAQLGGSFAVQRGGGAYRDGTTYDVLLADSGITPGSAFASIELPDPTRLLSFGMQQLADRIRIDAAVKPFVTVAMTANQMSMARNFDRILPSVTGDLNAALGTIQTLTRDADFATAFASLSPAAHEHPTRASLNTVHQYGQTLQDRMTALHVAEVPASAGEPVRVSLDESRASLTGLLATPQDPAAAAHGIWMKGFAQRGQQDATGSVNAYEHSLAGLALGIDARFGKTFLAGLSIGRASNSVKADVDRSDADVTSMLYALYGSYFDQRIYVNGTLAWGRNDYATNRTIVVGPNATPVTSRHRGDVQSASLGAGTLLRAGQSWLDPFANLQYTRLKEDGFAESGSGAGLIVDARTTNALISTIGLRWMRVFGAPGDATWTPEASLAWLHDFDRGGHLINAAYVDAPDASFSIAGQPVEKNGAVLGLGVTYRSTRGLATFLHYKGEFRNHYTAHGVIGEVRYEF